MRLLRVACVLVWRGICDGLRPKPRVTCCQEIAHRFLRWREVMSMAAATSAALRRQALENSTGRNAPMPQKHALLVYPAFATSFWSFKFALQYLGKKSSMPPLGLLTLASMFPTDYDLRLVDMNV